MHPRGCRRSPVAIGPYRTEPSSDERAGAGALSGGLDCVPEITDVADEQRDRHALGLAQVRAPNVENQYDARLVAAIPSLVFIGIVEHDDLAFAPTMLFAADHEGAVVRDDQRQVGDEPGVRDAP